MVGDPLNAATTDDGGTINVTSGKIDEVSTLTGNTAQTGDAYAKVNNATYGNNALYTILTSTGVNVAKFGGTTVTGRDIGASVLLSSGTGTGQISLSSGKVLLQATQTGVTIPTVTTLTNAPSNSSGVTTLLSRLSATRAGYLDNLTNLDTTVSSRGTSTLTAANVWQTDISGYSTAGYAGTYLKNAGGAADPWNTSLPGAYGDGTAGYIIGTYLDATTSSRLASASITLSGGKVTVGTNDDKTGYSISGTKNNA
jgi:hypothetical protein